MVVLNHASNVVGTLLPVAEVGRMARRHDLVFLVDAAQTAGAVPIDMEKDCIDLLVFSGHKALYGPMGTGGLVLGERVSPTRIAPLKRGGTGSRSEHEEQPEFLPDRFESGTPNAVGLAGLAAGASWVREQGVEAIRAREVELTRQLIDGLRGIRGVTVHGTLDAGRQTGTVSFNIDGMEASTVGLRLDDEYGILCRVGLHCSPAAHRTLGTFPAGSVRLGLGALSTFEEVRSTIEAVRGLAREAG
jgi:selenocysteine lyase/cysteine desulfurase